MVRLRQPYFLYLLSIAVIGGCIFLAGIWQIPTYEPKTHYFLLLFLATVAGLATTVIPVGKSGIIYEINNAISIAAVPVFGPVGAATVMAASSFGLWLYRTHKSAEIKRNWQQLFFNMGMYSIAIYLTGTFLLTVLDSLTVQTVAFSLVPWLVAAALYGQINAWLVIFILRLQNGPSVNMGQVWRENLWALSIDVVVMGVGGRILAFAIETYDTIGILIFFLPILLSAYAFRLYINQMQSHMDNLEEIIEERTQALRSLNQQKDAFLAVLTHDMKSPLTSINLYANFIKDYPDIVNKKPHVVDVILNSQEVLLDIVNNILDLEKISADGSLPLERDYFDFYYLVEERTNMLRAQAREKEIALTAVNHVGSVFIDGDQKQIGRVLSNLISNAIKYTPKQGAVEVSLNVVNGQAQFSVQDNGYGIPQEELPHIFDRYHRVEKLKEKASGTGLGLAIAKALIEAHEGTIQVVSQEGVGTTFTIMLPMVNYETTPAIII